MKDQVTEPVVQTQESSAINENQQSLENDAANNMPDDFKKDFFKQKQAMRDALAEKEEMAQKVREFEEKEAQRVGNHQKIIDTLKEENAKLVGSLNERDQRDQFKSFNDQLTNKAKEMGFTKPERIMNFLSKEDQELLVMDGSNRIDDFGMSKAFDNVKKEWGELFKPKHVTIADGNPTTNLNKTPPKTAKQMTSAERIALVLEMNKNK
jgi:hypothetical protein